MDWVSAYLATYHKFGSYRFYSLPRRYSSFDSLLFYDVYFRSQGLMASESEMSIVRNSFTSSSIPLIRVYVRFFSLRSLDYHRLGSFRMLPLLAITGCLITTGSTRLADEVFQLFSTAD
jgi:hypothetical protein